MPARRSGKSPVPALISPQATSSSTPERSRTTPHPVTLEPGSIPITVTVFNPLLSCTRIPPLIYDTLLKTWRHSFRKARGRQEFPPPFPRSFLSRPLPEHSATENPPASHSSLPRRLHAFSKRRSSKSPPRTNACLSAIRPLSCACLLRHPHITTCKRKQAWRNIF